MRVLLLSNPESSHTVKWVGALTSKGVDVYLLSLNPFSNDIFRDNPHVYHRNIGLSDGFVTQNPGSFSKIVYLKIYPQIKKAIKEFRPDILHSHYASSYGLLGALSNFHPFVLSVWGSDVYRFPQKSFLHREIIRYSLKRADRILSTSKNMVQVIQQYTSKPIEITPFGINTKLFSPYSIKHKENQVVVGTVKNLKKIYGIDVLIRAFKIVKEKNPGKNLKLLIVGEGPDRNRLEKLAFELGLNDYVEFTGQVAPSEVPDYINRMDIFGALSIYDESFGVSVLEAGACEKPAVVSDVPGFQEIVKNGETGFIIPRNNPEEAAIILDKLVNNHSLCYSVGVQARKHVETNYSLESSVNKMFAIYEKAINRS